jgi:UDP-perosamine 4-acetyltransferase
MKNKVIVQGAGGHAKVVIELLRSNDYQVDYCIGIADSTDTCMGVPVLRGDEQLVGLREKGYQLVFPAIGSNTLRARLGQYALDLGYQYVNAISPTAMISPSVNMGLGVAVMAGVVINADSQICDLAIINTGAVIDHDCYVGFASHCGPRSALAGCVRICEQSFLGVGAVVIPEVKIGKNTVIGAGATVIDNIPDSVLAVGIPAKVIKVKEIINETHRSS